MNLIASDATRDCPDSKMPYGTMHTGVGSTSPGVNPAEIAAGAALLGVAGASTLMLRRRRNGNQI